MRSRIFATVGVSAIALAVATAFAPVVGAHNSDPTSAHTSRASSLVHFRTDAPLPSCHRQLANDNRIPVSSQNFETALDIYDSQGADDFKLKAGCTVATVRVAGLYFQGPGPATSLHVTFYKNNAGTPGVVKSDQDNLGYTDVSGTGNFTIPLASPVHFRAHRYWVSVQVNLDYGTGFGQWGWNTNNVAKGPNSQWRNPLDGFGTGCVTYTDTLTCWPSNGEGPDFAFALLQ